jgi:RNA polymerase sigma-70 factor (ECF subfamily)
VPPPLASTDSVSDAELVEAARTGDAAAFGELVERYRGIVFRVALSVLGSRDEAEDAAQDAFLAAYRKLHMFRGEASFKTWLLAITWRHAIDRRGSLARRLRLFFSPDDNAWPEAAQPGPSQEQTLVDDELRERVGDVVKTLPRKYRDALMLASSGKHTFEEIARILNVPIGTAKWRVVEAKRQLRRKLAGLGYVDE